MIEFLLLDLDDTILDFHRAERVALRKTLEHFGMEPTEEVLALYHDINRWHWEQLEKGLLTRSQVLLGRFQMLFETLGREAEPKKQAEYYEQRLAQGHFFLPGAEKALERLYGHYRLFLVSNGTARVQRSRLASANLYRFFEEVFISQEVGFNKPAAAFFDACFEKIPGFDRERALMVGDSLTSDIQGGINAGVKTVWVNPGGGKRGNVRPDYEIEDLSRLPGLLERLDTRHAVSI